MNKNETESVVIIDESCAKKVRYVEDCRTCIRYQYCLETVKQIEEIERKATIHEKALELIKSERANVAKNLDKCESRWLHGYVDGLDNAIRTIEFVALSKDKRQPRLTSKPEGSNK